MAPATYNWQSLCLLGSVGFIAVNCRTNLDWDRGALGGRVLDRSIGGMTTNYVPLVIPLAAELHWLRRVYWYRRWRSAGEDWYRLGRVRSESQRLDL